MVELMPDRVDRILALISLSKNFKQVSDEAAPRPYPESHRIPGCESEVFAWVTTVSGLLRVDFAIENQQGVSAMALAVLLKEGLDGELPKVAESLDEELVLRFFGRELSMGKSLGLTNMVRSVRAQAKAIAASNS